MKTSNFKRNDLFTINPTYFFKELLRKAPYIILSGIIGSFIALEFANTFSTVSYKAVTKIIRYDKKISMPIDVPYKFQNFNYDTALETIRTRKNLNEVISKLNLDTPIEKLYSYYEIKRKKNSDIIEIFYTDETKEKAVLGANVLAEIFLKNFYDVQNAATKEVLKYYNTQKVSIKTELDSLFLKKEEFNKKNKILSITIQKNYKYEQLNEIALNLIDTKVLRNEYETKIKEINLKLETIPTEVQLEYSVRSADSKSIENKEKELDALKQKYTDINPKIQILKNEISEMKKNITLNKSKKNIPDEITYGSNPLFTALIIELSQSNIGIISSKNRIDELFEQEKIIENEIKDLNVLEKEYLVIDKKSNEISSLLDLVTTRQNELKIALESTQEDFKFLERAKSPEYPESSYKKAIVLGFSMSLSLFMTGFFILKIFFDSRVKESFDIEKRFNIKLLGKFIDTKESKIIKDNKMEFISNFMKIMKNKKIVLVSSDKANTGKSFIIDLITYFSSTTKQKVLYIQTISKISEEIKNSLIDCTNIENIDFRNINIVNEYIHKMYILDNELNDYYLANVNVSEKLFESLNNSEYELILFEVPSFETNSYFFKNFSSFADLVLLVFKFNYSDRKTIDLMIKEIQSLGINYVKGVLNVIDKKYN